MNIKFGMDNLNVRYLKRFLNAEMNRTASVLGSFDKTDLDLLVRYLNTPNTKTMFEVQREFYTKYPIMDKLFNIKLLDDAILWTSKEITQATAQFIREHLEEIDDFCKSLGWVVSDINDWIDSSKDVNGDGSVDSKDRDIIVDIIINGLNYSDDILSKADVNKDGFINDDDLAVFDEYTQTGKLFIKIQSSGRKNYFPNKDMLVFVNQFKGDFMYGYTIRDNYGGGIDDVPHKDPTETHKIAIYECKPGQKVTIAHNSASFVKLIIGTSPATLKQNIPNFMLTNVVEVTLKGGESYQYTCAEGDTPDFYAGNYLCIQCPSDYRSLTTQKKKDIYLEVGDINFDGKIDMLDYQMLAQYTAEGPGAEDLPYNKANWTPTAKQLAVMNTRKDDFSPNIDNADAVWLHRFIKGDPSIASLGVVKYEIISEEEADYGENVDNILIIDGHYDKTVNIPFKEFITDSWSVHEKFFNYLFGMAIHKYSNQDDIAYLQDLMKELYPKFAFDEYYFDTCFYTEGLQELVKDFQKSLISYEIGDLNKDGKITEADLVILRNYLDDLDLQKRLDKYVINPTDVEFTDEEFKKLDLNKDGVLDMVDKFNWEEHIKKAYAPNITTIADIDNDSEITESDYKLLELEAQGKTNNLQTYNVPFILGWLDVETEAVLEAGVNTYGQISEVSK
jgi:hypothetical protein